MRVTLQDVAKRAGVARNTASAILNNRSDSWASAATRERVAKAARELGYQPNQAAAGLRTGQFFMVGVLVPDLLNPFYAALVEALAASFETHGYSLLIEDSRGSLERERDRLERLARQNIDGVVSFLMDSSGTLPFFAEQAKRKRTVVYMGDFNPRLPGHHVGHDFFEGIGQAVAHLTDLGHRRIGFVQPLGEGQKAGHQDVFAEICRAQGLSDPWGVVIPCGHQIGAAFSAVASFLQETNEALPSALIALNDLTAVGAMRAALDHGLKVPGDLSVVGMDNTYLAEYLPIRLTTVEQPYAEMARQTVGLFVDAVENHGVEVRHSLRVPSRLVVRESTGPVRST